MCDQDGHDDTTYSRRLTAIHRKTEVKKTVNHAVVRKDMLDRKYLWLCPTISESEVEYALNRMMQ